MMSARHTLKVQEKNVYVESEKQIWNTTRNWWIRVKHLPEFFALFLQFFCRFGYWFSLWSCYLLFIHLICSLFPFSSFAVFFGLSIYFHELLCWLINYTFFSRCCRVLVYIFNLSQPAFKWHPITSRIV